MKNILLTGGSGFFGKIINKKLEEYANIINLSRNSGDYKICLSDKIPVFKNKFDIVIHAAGKAHSIPKTDNDRKEFEGVNVTGTANLLKGLEEVGVPEQFVFISSVSVYGQEVGVNISENFPLQAKDAYGLSKIKAEKMVWDWCKERNIICTILRLPLLVGKDVPGNLGAMIKAIINGYYFNIGGGKAQKSMVLGEDVASIILRVAPLGGIYNLTDGFHPTFNQLSLAISKKINKRKPLNLPTNLAIIIGRLGDFLGEKAPLNSLKTKKIISDLTFDDSKARVILGWSPQSVIDYINNNEI